MGPPLVTFADFASTEDLQKTRKSDPPDLCAYVWKRSYQTDAVIRYVFAEASFSVTIPKSSAFPTGACTTAGDCAVQVKSPTHPVLYISFGITDLLPCYIV